MPLMFKLHHPLYAFVLCAPVLLAQDGGQVQAPQAEKPVTNLDAQEGEYFATCDYDENGWISYREAEASLHLNRDGFAQYDADNNGQVTRDEFNTRYRLLLKRVGSFRIPTPESVTQVPVGAVPLSMQPVTALPNTSQAFVGLYDKDVNGMLNLAELTSASTALGFPGIPPTAILAKLDLNKNGWKESSPHFTFWMPQASSHWAQKRVRSKSSLEAQPLAPTSPVALLSRRRSKAPYFHSDAWTWTTTASSTWTISSSSPFPPTPWFAPLRSSPASIEMPTASSAQRSCWPRLTASTNPRDKLHGSRAAHSQATPVRTRHRRFKLTERHIRS
jgi:hypothetical protein